MSALGLCHEDRREYDTAEQWYRNAAAIGESDGVFRLARLLDARAQRTEATHWYTKAAEGGNAEAMAELSSRLCEQGNHTEAESRRRRAGEGGGNVPKTTSRFRNG